MTGLDACRAFIAGKVRRRTGRPALMIAPLAVGRQTAREATRFGIDGVAYRADGDRVGKGADPNEWPAGLRVREYPDVR